MSEEKPKLADVPTEKIYMALLFTALANHPKEQEEMKVKYLNLLEEELARRGELTNP